MSDVHRISNKAEGADFSWGPITAALANFRDRLRLLWVFVPAMLLLTLAYYFLSPNIYMATAVIGPPGTTTVQSLTVGAGSDSVASSVVGAATRRLLGGGAPAGDSFQEYLQILQSVRLAQHVADNGQILPVIFASQWDAERKEWKRGGALRQIKNGIKRALNMRVKDQPDVDDVVEFLNRDMGVTAIMASGSTVLPVATPYYRVSISGTDPARARIILEAILRASDDLIRQEQSRDVSARLNFLRNEMPSITLADQRQIMISMLSSQEQMRMVLAADRWFAHTLVDPPYASSIPTSPKGILFFVAIGIVFGLAVWLLAVGGTIAVPAVGPSLAKIENTFFGLR